MLVARFQEGRREAPDDRARPRVMRPVLRKLLVSAASAAVFLALAEVALRLTPPTRLGFSYVDGHFRRPSEFVPDGSQNSLGFHDAEPRRKRADTRRVLLLGDSYVEAASVPIEQTVGRRLESHLNARSDSRFDVVSIGRTGLGQSHQLQYLEQLGASLDPDLVLTLFVPLNDVRNNHEALQSRAMEQIERMQQFRPDRLKMPGENAPLFLFEGLVLNQLLSHRLALWRARKSPEIPIDYLVYATEYDREWEGAWSETEALLERTRAFSASLGARYAIVSASTPQGVRGPEAGLEILLRCYPAMRASEWDLDGPDRRLSAFCASTGIPLLSLEPAFRRITDGSRRLHWRYDGHWNAEGNDEAGRRMRELVLEALDVSGR